MPNPIFNALGGGQMPGPMGNFAQMVHQFNPQNLKQQVLQFKNQFSANANPQQIVMGMVKNGSLSQEQLNYAQQMGMKYQQMIGGVK